MRTRSSKFRFVVVSYGKNKFLFEGAVSHLKCVQTVPFFILCSCTKYIHAGRSSFDGDILPGSPVQCPQSRQKEVQFSDRIYFSSKCSTKPTPVDHHRVARRTLEVPGGPSGDPQLNSCVHALPYDPCTSRTYRGKSVRHNHLQKHGRPGVT